MEENHEKTMGTMGTMRKPWEPRVAGFFPVPLLFTLFFSRLQLKPELMPVEFGRKMKGVVSWDHSKEEQEQQKEVPVKQPVNEPTRIKIFEGGYVEQKLTQN